MLLVLVGIPGCRSVRICLSEFVRDEHPGGHRLWSFQNLKAYMRQSKVRSFRTFHKALQLVPFFSFGTFLVIPDALLDVELNYNFCIVLDTDVVYCLLGPSIQWVHLPWSSVAAL